MEVEFLIFTSDVGGMECTECDEIICTWPMTLATMNELASIHLKDHHT